MTISHFLGYEVRFRDINENIIYNNSFLEFHCSPIRSRYVQNKVLIGTWSQGCLLDSGVFIEQSLITIISLVSTSQWELHKIENKQGHSYRNEFSLMYTAQGEEV